MKKRNFLKTLLCLPAIGYVSPKLLAFEERAYTITRFKFVPVEPIPTDRFKMQLLINIVHEKVTKEEYLNYLGASNRLEFFETIKKQIYG